MQTDFATQVSERHGLARGVKGSTARQAGVWGNLQLDKPVVLPEREKASLGRIRGESDEDWHLRATLAATDAVQASALVQKDVLKDAESKLGVALDMIAHLKELAVAAKTRADEMARELARLKNGLEIIGGGKVGNHAVAQFDTLEVRIKDGDLTLIKEAAKDPKMLRTVSEVYEATTPDGTLLNDDQRRFESALTSTVADMAAAGKYSTDDLERIAVGKPALPYCEKALEHVRDGGLGSPFTNKADVLVFRAEVEATHLSRCP